MSRENHARPKRWAMQPEEYLQRAQGLPDSRRRRRRPPVHEWHHRDWDNKAAAKLGFVWLVTVMPLLLLLLLAALSG